MTDLQTKFAVLTDARPEPSDPAAPIRLRIRRRQRRRRGTAAVLVTAAAVTVTLAAGPALGALQGGTDAAGFAAPPTSTPSTPQATQETRKLPPPWSEKKFTKLPDANAYRPAAYYVAQGKIPAESWAMLSTNESCLVGDEGETSNFGDPFECFIDWPAGRRVDYSVRQGHTAEKSDVKIDQTLVNGAVSIEARKVRIVAGGKTYVTDAVGTPTTDRLRFFAIVIPQRDLKITSITPLDAAGRTAPAPSNPPTAMHCPDTCSTATPGNGTPS